MDRIKEEFSRFASSYKELNVIQQEVARKVATNLPNNISVVDLGCGNGTIKQFKNFKHYYGIDFSKAMLNLHKNDNNTTLKELDFNSQECFDYIKSLKFDYLISLSALQWAMDLDFIFQNIALLKKPFFIALFTSNTFKTVHKIANISSPIHSKSEILAIATKYFDFNYHMENYNLEFSNKMDMFRYIKKSGVSARRNILSYKTTKNLIKEYPLNYLEFEVIFLKG